jgi:DNA-directed RNA polymerase subunit RPC12/RpoP
VGELRILATNPEEMPSIRCSGCGKKLKYPAKLAGKQIGCPKCGTNLLLPVLGIENSETSDSNTDPMVLAGGSESEGNPGLDPTSPASEPTKESSSLNSSFNSLDDDDEFRLAPVETTPAKKVTTPLLPVNPLDDFDLGDFDNLAPPVEPSRSPEAARIAATKGSIGTSSSQQNAIPLSGPPKKPSAQSSAPLRTDFRYPCKVCGTSMYADINEVGSKVRCPDCYTEFSIPSPPPGWNKPRNIGPTSLDDGDAMPLAAAEGLGVRTSGPTTSSAEVMMERAAASLAEDDEKTRREIYDFESSGWAIRNFGFLKDPSAIVIALVTGVFLGGALVGALVIGGMAANSTSELERKESIRGIASNLALAILAAPIFLGALANGVAVLEAAANQLQRIARWPAFNIGEAMDEVMVVAAAFGIAALPGALLQWFGSSIGVPDILATIVMLLVTWFAFPVLLLSMLDNQAVTEPISQDVIKSMQSRQNAWGAMYMMTAMAFLFLFGLYLLQTNDRSGLRFTIGLVTPLLIFFVFHQYGLLAARISSVTELGFDSIEDDDEDQLDDLDEDAK